MPRQEAWLRIVTCRIEDGTQFMCTWTAWSGPVGGSAWPATIWAFRHQK